MENAKKILSEISVALVLITLIILFINPFGLWMDQMMHMLLLAMIAVAFAAFSAFFWREGAADEREILHRFLAARFAYLAGGILLILGTAVQALSDKIDPWLPATLATMVLAKIAGHVYARRNH